MLLPSWFLLHLNRLEKKGRSYVVGRGKEYKLKDKLVSLKEDYV